MSNTLLTIQRGRWYLFAARAGEDDITEYAAILLTDMLVDNVKRAGAAYKGLFPSLSDGYGFVAMRCGVFAMAYESIPDEWADRADDSGCGFGQMVLLPEGFAPNAADGWKEVCTEANGIEVSCDSVYYVAHEKHTTAQIYGEITDLFPDLFDQPQP